MRSNLQYQVKPGDRFSYDDGRPGHRCVDAVVLEMTEGYGMLVQFEDRADTTYIKFTDSKWMDCIDVVEG